MREIYLIAHDMRSTFNVGALFRTAEGLGIKKLFLTGYTPYPRTLDDTRLPHIINKLTDQIQKTALGSTELLDWEYSENIFDVINYLEAKKITITALEQTSHSVSLLKYTPPKKIAIVLGTELTGLPIEVLSRISTHLEIPMFGKKESFNVVQAAAMALFEFRFH